MKKDPQSMNLISSFSEVDTLELISKSSNKRLLKIAEQKLL